MPLVFGLLSGKGTFIYRKFSRHIFKKIRNLGAENENEKIITDYERGVISDIESDYPKIKHYRCFFQYSKAIYRKIQDFGLATAYRENPMLKKSFPKIYGCTVSPRKSSIGNAGGIFEWPSGNFHCETIPYSDGFSTIFPSNLGDYFPKKQVECVWTALSTKDNQLLWGLEQCIENAHKKIFP